MPIFASTAAEIEAGLAHWRNYNERLLRAMQGRFVPRLVREVCTPIFFPFLRRRPCTDDMMQMLDDLKIEPPDKQPPDFADITFDFDWSKTRELQFHNPPYWRR